MSAQKPHTRTRTGCHTCREAGYKCDEQKPFCGRCTRLKITCKGYALILKWKDSSSTREPRRRREERKNSSSRASPTSPTSTSSVSSSNVIAHSPTPAPSTNPELCTFDKRLMNYWNEKLAHLIAVAPKQQGTGPFQFHLTAMASDRSALQSTILSMAANHLALVFPDDPSWKLRGFHHQQQAIIRLQDLIQAPIQKWTTAEPVLAAVLMMQISSRIFSEQGSEPKVANHLIGAKAMISHRATMCTGNDTPLTRFLLSLFAYHDILSSIPRGSRPLLEHTDDFAHVEGDPSLQSIAQVLHVVARISELQELVKQTGQSSSSQPLLSGQAAAMGAEIEKSLLALDNAPLQTGSAAQPSDIFFTAEAFRHAAFIYLYRVWLNIGAPATSTLYHTQQCLACIEQIPIDSSLVACHLWPLWTAGCEVIGDEQRNFVRNRCLDMLRTRLFPSWKRIVQDIEDVWAAKDLERTVRGDSAMIRIDCIQVILKQRGREVELA